MWNLPSPGMQPVCLAWAGEILTTGPPRKSLIFLIIFVKTPLLNKVTYIGSTEKAMAPHSSTLAWKIPWVEEPGGLQSMGSLRVRHDWVTSLSLFTFMHWRRKWQPTPVFLPGESQGRGSLGGLPSMGSHRVGPDWSDLAAVAAAYRFQEDIPIWGRD